MRKEWLKGLTILTIENKKIRNIELSKTKQVRQEELDIFIII